MMNVAICLGGRWPGRVNLQWRCSAYEKFVLGIKYISSHTVFEFEIETNSRRNQTPYLQRVTIHCWTEVLKCDPKKGESWTLLSAGGIAVPRPYCHRGGYNSHRLSRHLRRCYPQGVCLCVCATLCAPLLNVKEGRLCWEEIYYEDFVSWTLSNLAEFFI